MVVVVVVVGGGHVEVGTYNGQSLETQTGCVYIYKCGLHPTSCLLPYLLASLHCSVN